MSSGFLTGYEMDWLPAVVGILRAELPSTEVVIHSQDSPDLAAASACLLLKFLLSKVDELKFRVPSHDRR
jgi:hypothetical protein